MSVLACISGHGFGHWTRSEALLERLAADGMAVHVRTSERALIPARRAGWVASLGTWDVGPGMRQRGPLEVDVAASRAALEEHFARWPAQVAAYAEEARALGARLVFADAPPIAFAVAERAGIPAVAQANFSWSWAYEHYADQDPFFAEAAARLRAAEALASARIALPGGGGLDAYDAHGRPPERLVALRRAPTVERAEARRRLPRPERSRGSSPEHAPPCVLLSFGGYGDALDLAEGARANPELDFVCFGACSEPALENLRVLPHDHDLAHQDLVLGADALIAKPGYGTVTECLNGPTPMVYVEPSGAFREHERLAEVIERWLPCARLTHAELQGGRWRDAVASARAAQPREAPPPNGLPEALEVVRGFL